MAKKKRKPAQAIPKRKTPVAARVKTAARKRLRAASWRSAASKTPKPPRSAPATKRLSWFDAKAHTSLIETHARKLDSFVEALADGVVEPSEIKAQEDRVVELMREVEPQLDDALHDKITRLLCEMAAYDMMQMIHAMHEARPKTKFRG